MEAFLKKGTEKVSEVKDQIIGYDTPLRNFLVSMKNRMGIGDPARNASDTYERGKKIVPDSIKSDEGEIPVKQYNIAILRNLFKFERAEGRMQVTNKRLVFRAAGRSVRGRTTLQHEYAINEIAGIEAVRNYKFSIQYLVGAILIICLSIFLISRCSSVLSGLPTPNNLQISSVNMMSPSHVRKARADERTAITQRGQAQEREREAIRMNRETAPASLNQAVTALERARQREARAITARDVATREEREYGTNSWFNWSQTYGQRREAAQREVNSAVTARQTAEADEKQAILAQESAEEMEKQAIEQTGLAIEKERDAIKKRESTENVWKVFMTIIGLILGICGLIPFFILYKKFGLKLFLLIFSIFGFVLSLTASGSFIFYLLWMLATLTTIACVFIFCFRPNLIISIKNKMGAGDGPVNIRRDEHMNRIMGIISLFIGLIPISIFWGTSVFASALDIFDSFGGDIIGSILPIVLLIILLIILLPAVMRSIQSKNKESGMDFAEVIPTEETEFAIREIGAIIGDIQKLGDLGINKWVEK